ncbi:hypothetical protein FHS59_002751 [Algoriphagus iocasae]|uniref:Tail spike domain-containing protein n=1 Tax=Algoriphagus iocasae TaxID=1836499 RepID=A0A841MJR4_9BACT|nr:phage tail protein [Algoriphagus iocasae]MBB6327123.1 hypothetical protein [Algoriphagus iocasae]
MDIFENSTLVHSVSIDDQTVYSCQLMGEDKITAVWISSNAMEINIGDYIEHKGQRYSCNLTPTVEKIDNRTFRYEVVFESQIYSLFRKKLKHLYKGDFTYTADLSLFLQLLIDNMNSIDSGWSFLTDGYETPLHTIGFKGESCRAALTRICETFGMEFRLNGKQIIVKPNVGFLTTQSFQYGRGQGLYKLSRENVNENSVVTRLFVYGGTKNIPFDYREGSERLIFAPPATAYLENFDYTDLIIEGDVYFDDIYPERTGFVTSSPDPLTIIDLGIDFDINDYLLENEEAKIVFTSGSLSGIEFVINKYDHPARKISLNKYIEGEDFSLPSETRYPEAGDKYVLVDIRMPESYITDAEARLLAAGTEYLNKVKSPKVLYRLDIDEKYVRDTGIEVGIGNTVQVIDASLGIDDRIRVVSVSYPLVNPSKVTCGLSESIPLTVTERMRKDVATSKVEIREVDRKRAENLRESTQRLRQLQGLIYDADGYFNPVNIKPGSIETIMLAVGQKSQNLILDELIVTPNVGADPDSFEMSAADVVHLEYEIEGLGFDWEIDLRLFEDLDPAIPYYVYARCSKTALTGTWELSPTPILTEQESGFYHFWIGVLYQVNNGLRAFEFTTGMTYIIGGQTITGRIRSADGLNYMDLTQGTFKLGDTEQSIDWGVTVAGQLTINGVVVSKMSFTEDAEIINLIVHNLKTQSEGKRIQILETENALKFINDDEEVVLEINDSLGTDADGNIISGIRVNNPSNGGTSWLSGGGVFSNASGVAWESATTGRKTNASLVGLLQSRNSESDGISAAIVGIDQTTELDGDSKSYGGYFNSALIGSSFINALNLKVKVIEGTTYTIDNMTDGKSTFFSCYNDSGLTITLPVGEGQRVIYIRRNNSAGVTINRAGSDQILNPSTSTSVSIPDVGGLAMLVWDGSYWTSNML